MNPAVFVPITAEKMFEVRNLQRGLEVGLGNT